MGKNPIANHFLKEEHNIMNELLTASEVAQILHVNDTTVRRWVKQGALQAVILPHRNARQAYRFTRETVERILQTTIQVH